MHHTNTFLLEHTKIKIKKHSLANWTPPGSSFTVELKVRFKIKALNVFTFMASCREGNPLEGDGTFQRYLDKSK